MAKNLWDYPHIIDIFADDLFHDLSEYGRESELYERFLIEQTASPRNVFVLGNIEYVQIFQGLTFVNPSGIVSV